MGRGYLPELLQFILTFSKDVSTSDQNYHILKVVSVETKVVKKKTRVKDKSPAPLTFYCRFEV